MKLTSYIIEEDLLLREESPDVALPEKLKDGRPRWIDITDPDDEELRELLVPLVHDDTIIEDFILKDRNLPVAHSEHELYFEFPVITGKTHFELEYISFLSMPSLLVTIHNNELRMMSKLASDLCRDLHLQRATIASLLYHILGELVEKNHSLYMELREQITELSSRVIREKSSIDLNAILHIKKHTDRVNVMVEDQLYCIDILLVYEGPAFDIGKQRKNFRNLEEEVRNGFRFLSRYERRLEDLHQHYDLMLQDRTNNRLKVLTIVAAIFLPLNLVAGIYGMNFDNMPILHWGFAYHAIIGFMLLIALAMLYYFYRAGWFK